MCFAPRPPPVSGTLCSPGAPPPSPWRGPGGSTAPPSSATALPPAAPGRASHGSTPPAHAPAPAAPPPAASPSPTAPAKESQCFHPQ
eukprot:8888272-Pyramimonas_sp.AAC.1